MSMEYCRCGEVAVAGGSLTVDGIVHGNERCVQQPAEEMAAGLTAENLRLTERVAQLEGILSSARGRIWDLIAYRETALEPGAEYSAGTVEGLREALMCLRYEELAANPPPSEPKETK